jgi:N-acyl-D-aspartate/D-glutamate deacylase
MFAPLDLVLLNSNLSALHKSNIVRDLPAGGRRLLQEASGYIGTWVAGQCVQREGQITAARPGRLVRMGQ